MDELQEGRNLQGGTKVQVDKMWLQSRQRGLQTGSLVRFPCHLEQTVTFSRKGRSSKFRSQHQVTYSANVALIPLSCEN